MSETNNQDQQLSPAELEELVKQRKSQCMMCKLIAGGTFAIFGFIASYEASWKLPKAKSRWEKIFYVGLPLSLYFVSASQMYIAYDYSKIHSREADIRRLQKAQELAKLKEELEKEDLKDLKD
mmetsp:Transcript_20230/g.22907  ORF Transcript_20230/g.22907 Transcript_20230/m.22907 type:complete len:123 (+) Transcript_20230:358-726(+)